MASTEPAIRPLTIAIGAVGTIVAAGLAYAVYFDNKRRTDPEFRRNLKRASKAQAKASKAQEERDVESRKSQVKAMVNKVNEEGVPTDPEEVEKYFMDEVAEGEILCQDASKYMDAALCFFRALKVYPQPGDLINIYDRTVPKPVLDILAEMIAIDPTISVGPSSGGPRGPPEGGMFGGMGGMGGMGSMGDDLPEEPLDE